MILELKLKVKNRDDVFKLIGELNLEKNIKIEKFEIDGKKLKGNNKKL